MNRLKRRAVSLLLAAVMFLGLFPPATLTALAADESIKLTGCDFTGMSYHSEALGNASIHTMDNACCQGEFFAAILISLDMER